jgi:transcriptional regulator with PAS, ATPase and Fis domain
MDTEILGARTGLARIMPLVGLAARTRVNVLIHGETGTGKEVVARAIHRRSPAWRGPFVVANCAAIPHDLMESEMFGHVRGAYTGAVREHGGYFASARGGTLLLDEIGDLHLDLQAKMLHVVESGSYRKVGSTRAEQNSARLLAATHRSLGQLIEEGRFRADLFYRLDVLRIDLPPLRERGADIEKFARHFLVESCARNGRDVPELNRDALTALQSHDWPGNIRELKTCMERLTLLTQGGTIRGDDVRATLESSHREPGQNAVKPLADVEREAIERALRHFGQNRTRAARALGISRRTLQARLREYGRMTAR